MDQNTKPMEVHLWQKTLLYTTTFQQTPMSCQEVIVLYRSCFILALTYPLPVTWLPDQFFDKIHHVSTSMILNKMDYHQKLPQSMVFAPQSMGGVGLCHLQHKMETQQILILLQHMRVKTPLGQMFEILACLYQSLSMSGLAHGFWTNGS